MTKDVSKRQVVLLGGSSAGKREIMRAVKGELDLKFHEKYTIVKPAVERDKPIRGVGDELMAHIKNSAQYLTDYCGIFPKPENLVFGVDTGVAGGDKSEMIEVNIDFAEAERRAVLEYAAKDAEITMEVFKKFELAGRRRAGRMRPVTNNGAEVKAKKGRKAFNIGNGQRAVPEMLSYSHGKLFLVFDPTSLKEQFGKCPMFATEYDGKIKCLLTVDFSLYQDYVDEYCLVKHRTLNSLEEVANAGYSVEVIDLHGNDYTVEGYIEHPKAKGWYHRIEVTNKETGEIGQVGHAMVAWKETVDRVQEINGKLVKHFDVI